MVSGFSGSTRLKQRKNSNRRLQSLAAAVLRVIIATSARPLWGYGRLCSSGCG